MNVVIRQKYFCAIVNILKNAIIQKLILNKLLPMKLISVNIEFDKHYDTVLPFLKKENPDVICLQEVVEGDFEMFKKELGMDGMYKPIDFIYSPLYDGPKDIRQGEAVFAKNIIRTDFNYYIGSEQNVMRSFDEYFAGDEGRENNVLLSVTTADQSGKEFTFATTHFTLTKFGESTPHQLANLEKLFDALTSYPEIVLCGDMNAPRGNETFTRLAKKYKDNIPAQYDTSIDSNLHRTKNKDLKLMVDGLFTTPKYVATNVQLVDGVSDHMAIVADIEIIEK